MRLPSNKSGFSLAELIIVVVIIGFLAALVIGVVSNAASNSRDRTKIANAVLVNRLVITARNSGATVVSSTVAALITELKAGIAVPNTAIVISLPATVNMTASSYMVVAGSNPIQISATDLGGNQVAPNGDP